MGRTCAWFDVFWTAMLIGSAAFTTAAGGFRHPSEWVLSGAFLLSAMGLAAAALWLLIGSVRYRITPGQLIIERRMLGCRWIARIDKPALEIKPPGENSNWKLVIQSETAHLTLDTVEMSDVDALAALITQHTGWHVKDYREEGLEEVLDVPGMPPALSRFTIDAAATGGWVVRPKSAYVGCAAIWLGLLGLAVTGIWAYAVWDSTSTVPPWQYLALTCLALLSVSSSVAAFTVLRERSVWHVTKGLIETRGRHLWGQDVKSFRNCRILVYLPWQPNGKSLLFINRGEEGEVSSRGFGRNLAHATGRLLDGRYYLQMIIGPEGRIELRALGQFLAEATGWPYEEERYDHS